jgi:hypothetical protein
MLKTKDYLYIVLPFSVISAALIVFIYFSSRPIDLTIWYKNQNKENGGIKKQAFILQKSQTTLVEEIQSKVEEEKKHPITNSIPLEWEEPLFQILLNEQATPADRCMQLIDLATNKARGVPSVQQECLKHLIYSLKDDDLNSFLYLSSNINIPLQMRIAFVQEVVGIRPDSLNDQLCDKLSTSSEKQLSECARDFLKDREAEKKSIHNN